MNFLIPDDMHDKKLTDVTDNKVGKITDNEMIKALECCTMLRYDIKQPTVCVNCPYYNLDDCTFELKAKTVDLINRLQAKVIKEQNKNSKLRNERNRLQAQNKDLAEAVHNLTLEKDALFDKSEELKSEVERLKEFIVETRRCDKEIKSEAVKEFAEKLTENLSDCDTVIDGHRCGYYCGDVRYEIDKLVKEMVGETMTDRDRLIEILQDTLHEWECDVSIKTLTEIAEHLLANGVIVPPCKVGDKVWYITGIGHNLIKPAIVKEIIIDGKGIKDLYVCGNGYNFENSFDIFYLTREEAEKALEERNERTK